MNSNDFLTGPMSSRKTTTVSSDGTMVAVWMGASTSPTTRILAATKATTTTTSMTTTMRVALYSSQSESQQHQLQTTLTHALVVDSAASTAATDINNNSSNNPTLIQLLFVGMHHVAAILNSHIVIWDLQRGVVSYVRDFGSDDDDIDDEHGDNGSDEEKNTASGSSGKKKKSKKRKHHGKTKSGASIVAATIPVESSDEDHGRDSIFLLVQLTRSQRAMIYQLIVPNTSVLTSMSSLSSAIRIHRKIKALTKHLIDPINNAKATSSSALVTALAVSSQCLAVLYHGRVRVLDHRGSKVSKFTLGKSSNDSAVVDFGWISPTILAVTNRDPAQVTCYDATTGDVVPMNNVPVVTIPNPQATDVMLLATESPSEQWCQHYFLVQTPNPAEADLYRMMVTEPSKRDNDKNSDTSQPTVGALLTLDLQRPVQMRMIQAQVGTALYPIRTFATQGKTRIMALLRQWQKGTPSSSSSPSAGSMILQTQTLTIPDDDQDKTQPITLSIAWNHGRSMMTGKRKSLDDTVGNTTTNNTMVVLGPGQAGGDALHASEIASTIKKVKTMTTVDANKNKDAHGPKNDEDDDEIMGDTDDDDDNEPTIAERLRLLQQTLDDEEDEEEQQEARLIARITADHADDDDNGDMNNSQLFVPKKATTESLTLLMQQALPAGDDTMLELALAVRDPLMIAATCQQLEADLLTTLLTALTHRLAVKPSRADALCDWLAVVLQQSHRLPAARHHLQPLRNLLQERLEVFPALLQLEGRLRMMGGA